MGLRALKTYSLAASIASWNQCRSRVKFILCDQFKDDDNNDDAIFIEDDFDKTVLNIDKASNKLKEDANYNDKQMKNQKLISSYISKGIYEDFFDKLDNKDKHRIIGCRAYGATSWISSLPMPHYGLSNDEFLYTAKTWLGINILSDNQTNLYIACEEKMDKDYIMHDYVEIMVV